MKLSRLPPEVITQVAAVTDGQIRLGPLMGVPGLLQELGEDPRALIESAAVDPRLFDDPENVIDFAGVGRLLARCAASTARPHFGLLLGRTTGLDALGLLGLLVRHSPDAGAALGNLVLHLLIHDRGAVPVYAIEGSQVLLGYSIYQPRVEGTRQIYDLAVCVGRNVMRTLCGTGWRATEVRLPYRRPVDIEPYRRHFQAPLRFDAERAAVVFPADVLRCPVQGADPAVYKALEERVAALEEHGVGDIVAQVRRVLRNLLLSGRGPSTRWRRPWRSTSAPSTGACGSAASPSRSWWRRPVTTSPARCCGRRTSPSWRSPRCSTMRTPPPSPAPSAAGPGPRRAPGAPLPGRAGVNQGSYFNPS